MTGFLLTAEQETNFWQGIIWLDDKVKTREEGLEKLSDLLKVGITSNLKPVYNQMDVFQEPRGGPC